MIALSVLPVLNRIGWSLPLFVIAFVALWFAKLFYQWTEQFSFSDQLTEKDNPAFGTALTGYLVGTTIAITGAFVSMDSVVDAGTLLSACASVAGQGLLVALLMRAGVLILSRAILYRFGVREEMIRDRNVGAGAVVAGSCLASGLVLRAALSGHSDTVWLGIRDVLVYWAVGQAILVIGAWLFIKTVHFDVHKALEVDNNAAAGFSLGGFLVAVGITVNAALTNASSALADELVITLVCSAIGLGLLVCAAIIAGRVFLPESPVAKEISIDKNPAAGLISAGCFIAVSLLLARVITL
jgi:putative membrane protein